MKAKNLQPLLSFNTDEKHNAMIEVEIKIIMFVKLN